MGGMMIAQKFMEFYQGQGLTLDQRDQQLPECESLSDLEHPAHYMASSGLKDAVNVALTLGQPLLITGEPGTGKTRLAASVAYELGLGEPLTFHIKTTSLAADLFYHYDALRRFQDIQMKEKRDIRAYITCRALGTAILLALKEERAVEILPPKYRETRRPGRSVVLIDEIDKAPRDLPNDILNEVESMQFRIKETTWPAFKADPGYRPILILTSNSEKDLPDAFLRRCVFFHIEFPDAATLKEIVKRRFQNQSDPYHRIIDAVFLDNAVDHFEEIRGLHLKKRPATAEFLAWIIILAGLNVNPANIKSKELEKIKMSYSVLAKSKEDFIQMKNHLMHKYTE
jgi:MoxR-like ATPase